MRPDPAALAACEYKAAFRARYGPEGVAHPQADHDGAWAFALRTDLAGRFGTTTAAIMAATEEVE